MTRKKKKKTFFILNFIRKEMISEFMDYVFMLFMVTNNQLSSKKETFFVSLVIETKIKKKI